MSDRDKAEDKSQKWALFRYMVISAYLALAPPRGQRGATLAQLAAKAWVGPDGEPFHVAAETIRKWIARYQHDGLDGLRNRAHPGRGPQALTPELVELVCQLKREVPERSLDRLIRIAERMELVEPGSLRRSTVHRVLRAHGLSKRALRIPDTQDLDRFEADYANDLWQSDMLYGPFLPDPERPDKQRRAYLYAFLDDYSRCLLHGRFSFRGELPALELVFRRSLQKFGTPRRVYFDNGAVYHSGHVKHIVATLGVHRIIFTERGRPQGHGKIEALNRLIRAAFIAELKTSQVRTLDELNEAFVAWADHDYNRVVHGETGEEPWARWKSGVGQIQYADEENLRQAFLWREQRTADKAGIFSLFGTKYQVGPELARRRFELRYDPEMLDIVEVWHQGKMCERVRPFQVKSTRRPKISLPNPLAPPAFPQPPVADYLGHLVSERRAQGHIEPSPHDLAEAARAASLAAEQAVVDLLHDVLDPAVVDEPAIRDHCQRFGPFSPSGCEEAITPLIERGLTDQHISVYLEAIVRLHRQGDRP